VDLDFAAVGSGSYATDNLEIRGLYIAVEAYDSNDNIIGKIIRSGTKNRAGSNSILGDQFVFVGSGGGTPSYPEVLSGIGTMPTIANMYFKLTLSWESLSSTSSPGATLNILCDKVRIDKYAPKSLMNRMGFEQYSTPSSYVRFGGDVNTIRGDIFMEASQSFASNLGVTGNVGINDPSGSSEKYNLWVGTGYTSGSHGGIGTSQGIRAKEFKFYESFEPLNDGSSTGVRGDSSGSKIWHRPTYGITFDTQIKDLYGLGGFSQIAGYINQSGFYAVGNVTAYASDLRLKENIELIPNPIEKIKKISGVTFDWKKGVRKMGFIPSDDHEHGMIAQEVEKVIPDAIAPAPFNLKYKTIRYEKVIPLLIEGIKEQQEQIEGLKEQLNTIVCGSLEPQ